MPKPYVEDAGLCTYMNDILLADASLQHSCSPSPLLP